MRCTRCGREAADQDKFCAECGMFLRDAFPDQRFQLALTLETEGKPQDARRELERLVELHPAAALPWHCLGTMHFHQGTLNRAIDCYRRSLELAPRFLLCWYDLGVAYYHRGNMPASIAAYRRCLELDPHYNAAHYRLGVALFHAGDLDAAREHFEKCTGLTPEYLRARYHVGLIHQRKGDLDAAEREFWKADAIDRASRPWETERRRDEARGRAAMLDFARDLRPSRMLEAPQSGRATEDAFVFGSPGSVFGSDSEVWEKSGVTRNLGQRVYAPDGFLY